MQRNIPTLFVEINETNYIFLAGIYNEDQNFEILDKLITPCNGIYKNKFTNINEASELIKKSVDKIEIKLNCVFKDIILVIENFDISCVNVSGYKKLNGSKVLKENISYILNSIKLAINENEKQKTILHIFNSKSILDGVDTENLPIGLYGDFYSHELTFFLIRNNDLKNIKQVFSKSNLNIKKIILKNFSEGAQLINEKKDYTFFKIKIKKESSQIVFFENSSLRYLEKFKFGSNIILKDITKVCSINNDLIINYLADKPYKDKNLDKDAIIDKKYFINSNFRKIKKDLITEIASSRIHEIINIIMNRNVNIKNLKKKILRFISLFRMNLFLIILVKTLNNFL